VKIAYLKAYDTRDKRTASGMAYYIACALEKHCGEVVHLSPIPFANSKEKLLGKAINKITRYFLGKEYEYHESFLLSRLFARVAASWLEGQTFDVIVSLAGDPELAFLETDIPIVSVHDLTEKLLIEYYYPFHKQIVKRSIYEMNVIQERVLKKASAVIYSSAWAAQSAIEDYGADPKKIHVVPFGANLDEVPPREIVLARKKSERCRLLFLGVQWVRKGGDIAFETLLKLEELGIQAELIVCGCTPPEGVAHERMKVIPFLDKNDERQHKELEQLLMSADFLLLPTRSDFTPIVFCEASAFGLPVIATSVGGVPEIVRNGENGFLLPYEARGESYAELIARLYCDDECYAELVRTSRTAFEERLNWDAWGVAVKHILADLLDHENSSGNSLRSLVAFRDDK
jgi:glycosyltransferase involved in cell wall biosynthesis